MKLKSIYENIIKESENSSLDTFRKILSAYSPDKVTKYDENVSGFELKKVNSGISSVTFYMDSSEDVPYPFYINFWGEYDSDELK